MFGFVDETVIEVSSGHGGTGCISFRREKYVPRGGPDGGNGGKGGDVLFTVKRNLKTLAHLRMKRVFRAQNGRPGEGRRKHGRDGKDAIVEVPPGIRITDADTDELIADLTEESTFCILKGGKGGKGNWHFTSSVRQAPRYAQPGLDGEERKLKIVLSVIADIGFVGFPNAGKSSLLAHVTNAHPKIANYPFTTKIPNLGVMDAGFRDIILADIPGIIEGASHGAGLGFRFLKHISRTKGLAFLIDLSEDNYHEAFEVLRSELETYAPELIKKPRVVIGTKLDLLENLKPLEELKGLLPVERVIGISCFSRRGIDELREGFIDLTKEP